MSEQPDLSAIETAARLAVDAIRQHVAKLRIAAAQWQPRPAPPRPR